jgi:hypothetical protein
MHTSGSLGGDHYRTQQTSRYLQLLRDFRNGHVDDLSEPWTNEESGGYCSIRQRIKGHQISFSHRAPDALPQPKPEWTHETINGETVNRATVPLVDVDHGLHVGDAEIVAFGDVPDPDGDGLFLRVSLQDASPDTVRQAVFSVGVRTWSLNRIETNLLLAGASQHKLIEYWAGGEAAEQILSAMVQPSRIAVSATIVLPNSAAGVCDALLRDELDAFVGPAPPGSKAADSCRVQGESPELHLRFESRSTQLSGVIKTFHACYAGRGR